jgi:membrane protein DedA with SNARE-associated domain
VLSLIGTVIYATVLSVVGYELGHAWQSVSHGLTIVGYALFAIVVIAIVAFVLYRLRQFRREGAQGAELKPAPEPPAAPRRPGRHRSDLEV